MFEIKLVVNSMSTKNIVGCEHKTPVENTVHNMFRVGFCRHWWSYTHYTVLCTVQYSKQCTHNVLQRCTLRPRVLCSVHIVFSLDDADDM